jgi:hypothetical protein
LNHDSAEKTSDFFNSLLEGICAEAAEILKDKHIALNTFTELKKMLPMRQIEAAEPMVAMDKYTLSYAQSLLAATPQIQMVESEKPKRVKGLTDEQVALMERESVNLEREFRIAEQSYGADHLDLVLTNGYLGALLGNARVVRYLAQHQREILIEFQKLVSTAARALKRPSCATGTPRMRPELSLMYFRQAAQEIRL